MKKRLAVLLLLLVTIFILGCGETKEEPAATNETEQKEKLDVMLDMLTTDKDLFCDMTLTNDTIADTAIYKGQLYGFCCDHCKAEFKKDPEQLIAKLNK